MGVCCSSDNDLSSRSETLRIIETLRLKAVAGAGAGAASRRRELKRTRRLLALPSEPTQARLFLSCAKPTLFGRYRHSGQWLLCRIRSLDIDETYTIVWEDGSLQVGTKFNELQCPTQDIQETIEELLLRRKEAYEGRISNHHEVNNNIQSLVQSREEEITVWEAAKRGDMATTLAIIDRGDATPNDVELLDEQGAEGRTPLYWACFIGHVELVRELLARGGIDSDGTCYLAVTSREKADDERDLMFNPDDNVFSDWVDYNQGRSSLSKRDETLLIRCMLLAASSRESSKLPTRLYESADNKMDSSEGLCVVCLDAKADAIPSPCGHIACCVPCLSSIRDNREGCPICRSRIVAIISREGKTGTPHVGENL